MTESYSRGAGTTPAQQCDRVVPDTEGIHRCKHDTGHEGFHHATTPSGWTHTWGRATLDLTASTDPASESAKSEAQPQGEYPRWAGSEPQEVDVEDLDDLTRAELAERGGAPTVVASVLDDWLARKHGILSGHHGAGLFLDLLAAQGYRVEPIDPGPPLVDLLPPPNLWLTWENARWIRFPSGDHETMVMRHYLTVCRDCPVLDNITLVYSHGSGAERREWRADHAKATGHSNWWSGFTTTAVQNTELRDRNLRDAWEKYLVATRESGTP